MAKAIDLLRGIFRRDGGNVVKSMDTLDYWADPFSVKSSAGVNVTPDKSLQHSAVWASVRLLSETIASLPFGVVEKTKDGRKLAGFHPSYNLLHSTPNRMMTSFTFRQMMMTHMQLTGNFFAVIVFGKDERPVELIPVDPSQVEVIPMDGRIYYKIQGYDRTLQDYEVLHTKGLTMDGIVGLSPIGYAREGIGAGLAAQTYSGELMSNGITATGVIETPNMLKADQLEDLRKQLRRQFKAGKTSNSDGIAVLYNGMKFSRIAIPPVDAQFLEQRKFSVTEIARIFRVPPHMIADLDRATFSNIEHQAIEFVQYSLMPWIKSIEMEFDRKIFLESEKSRYGTKLNVDGLLRGDTASRQALYHTMKLDGNMTTNEIRMMENLPSIGDEGDIMLYPVNMTTMKKIQQDERDTNV